MLEVPTSRSKDKESEKASLLNVLSTTSSDASVDESGLLGPQESDDSLASVNSLIEPQDIKNEDEQERNVSAAGEVEEKWSTLLQSPSESSFSPSLPISKSLHGLALTVAVERARTLTKCGHRCANLLHAGKESYRNN